MASSSSSSPEISPADPVIRAFSYKDATKEEVLEDLSSRFILNLPDEELTSLERLCFQVEQAHWFYEDFIREQNNKLPSLPLKKFSEMLFRACPLLNKWSDSHEQAFNDFMQYKTRVPVCGAIMLNAAMDKCVLVKGWKASSGWGFPKGKINQTEPEVDCAVREVLEETGYNLADQIDPKNVINFSIKEQKIFLYIVPGVPEDFPFETKTRKEISKIQWFNLADLPTWKKNKSTPGRFYLISPFISGLKAFINQNKPRNNSRKNAKPRKALPNTSQQQAVPQELQYQKPARHSDAPTVNVTSQPSSSLSNSELAANSFDSVLDPHMSRLLSSLTMSATSIAANTPQNVSRDTNNRQPAPIQPPSPRPSNTSADSPVVMHFLEQPDWSSSIPLNFNPQPSEPLEPSWDTSAAYDSSAGSGVTPSHAKANGSAKIVAGNSTDARHLKTVTALFTIPSSAPSPAIIVPSTSPPSQPMASPTSPTSRRSSSTADISPYLSRATAVPTSAKRLQQLSLLESVASESEKLAPIIAARAAMVNRGSNGLQFPPQPPMNPSVTSGNLRDVGVLYSSMHPPPPASAAGFHPRPLDLSGPGYHDPFQVRARTSQAFHRTPMHNPTGSVNMNQNQLLATINGGRVPLHVPGPQMHPQFLHEQLQPHQFINSPQIYSPPANRQYSPPQSFINGPNGFSNILPPQPPLPITGFRPYPNPNPNMPTSTAISLLSILNGRPSQQPNFPAQVHR